MRVCADILSPRQRGYYMSRIRGKNTKPEYAVRRVLFADGFRYRLHDASLPGKPGLVFAKHRAAVFVHGCFWRAKIKRNLEKDRKSLKSLLEKKWRVLTIWECALKGTGRLSPEQIAAGAER